MAVIPLYTFNCSFLTLSDWNTMSAAAKTSFWQKIILGFIELEKNNVDTWIGLNIPQGTVFTTWKLVNGSLNIGAYSIGLVNDVYSNYHFKVILSFDITPYIFSGTLNFTTPLKSVVIPEPEKALTKYIEFMQKASLYNSYVKNVNAEMVKKQTVQVIKDFIFSIFKDLKDGMVIFDYYQWQGEDPTGNYDMRMYKRFYIRVFGISSGSLVQKSFQIDHTLFAGIAGAGILDNGILISNDGLTEKVGAGLNSYQRKGYIIHANNCNLETFIQKLQEDSAYTLETLEFPDFDSLQEQIQKNKDFLTKNGKTAQQIYDEKYAEKYAYYQRFKDVLGLTNADCATYAKEAATAYTQDYIKTLNDTIATEATVSQGKVAEQEYQQSQASQSVEQAKAEAEAGKALDDKARALEKAKSVDKDCKMKIIDYNKKVYSIIKKSGGTGSLSSYNLFDSYDHYSSLKAPFGIESSYVKLGGVK